MAVVLGLTLSVQAASIYWTGNGDDNLWSNTNNWHGFALPTGDDNVFLGHATYTPDEPLSVVVDVDAEVSSIYFAGTGNRETTLVSTNGARVINTAVTTYSLYSWTTANVHIETITDPSTSQVRIFNHSSDALLTFGPGHIFTNVLPRLRGVGTMRLQETQNETLHLYIMEGSKTIADLKGGDLSTGSTAIFGDSTGHTNILYLASDANLPGTMYIFDGSGKTGGGTGFAGATESEQDVRLTLNALGSLTNDVLQIVPSLGGSAGNLIVQVNTFNANGASVATIADSIVQIRNTMLAADNPGVSGEGNLLLKADTAETQAEIRRHMTYTGRTMIERGIMLFTATNPGSLSPETILEIGGEGALRFLAHQQTVAGLRDYNGTAGEVQFMNAAARLTVATAEDSAFGGEIHGNGAVRGTFEKTGAAAFTLTQGGSIHDISAVIVNEGTLGLAGGRIDSGSFTLTNATFAVTLSMADVEATLVTAGTANVTGATLQLFLADGYAPAYGAEFTLLDAGTIVGASAADMFGYAHGDEIDVGGTPFLIHYIDNNDSITLTAIPEPGSLALLVLAAAGLWTRRRRAATAHAIRS